MSYLETRQCFSSLEPTSATTFGGSLDKACMADASDHSCPTPFSLYGRIEDS